MPMRQIVPEVPITGQTPTRRVVDYVIECRRGDQIDNAVRARIANGWQPFGSVSILQANSGRIYYAQALVKYED